MRKDFISNEEEKEQRKSVWKKIEMKRHNLYQHSNLRPHHRQHNLCQILNLFHQRKRRSRSCNFSILKIYTIDPILLF
jgi:hypothetical protein